MSGLSYSDLPPDMQRLLAQWSRDLVRASPQLSSIGGTVALQEEYIRQICQSPPSPDEIQTLFDRLFTLNREYAYFSRASTLLGQIYVGSIVRSRPRPRQSEIYTSRLSVINRDSDESTLYPRGYPSIIFQSPTIISPSISVDLYSAYRIYRSRLTCQRLRPDLAKKKILETINDLFKSLEQGNLYEAGSAVIYVLLNSDVLGISNYIPETPITNLTIQKLQPSIDAALDQLVEIQQLAQTWA